MSRNEGVIDRTVRIIAGLALIASPLGLYGADYASVWGWIGVVPLLTGLVGVCPAYALVGINTCSR